MKDIAYPDMENLIWPECLKLIENSQPEKKEKWVKIMKARPNEKESIETFRAISKKCIDTTGPETLEPLLAELIVVSCYKLYSVYNLKWQSTVDVPDILKYIWPRCKDIIEQNAIAKGKGNSWLEMYPTEPFWFRKLREECYEVVMSKEPVDIERELYDVINVASFMLHLIIKRRKRYESVGLKQP